MGLASRVGRMSLECTASTLGGFVSARQAAGGELEAMADEERDRRVGLGFDEVGGDMATLRWEWSYICLWACRI